MRALPPCLLVGVCAVLLYAEPGDGKDALHSSIDGKTVTIAPDGPMFDVPAGWIEWHRKFGTALHLTRAEIDATKDGGGEWDTEHAEILNATLAFEKCGFAGGSEGWGKDAVAFSDVQVRVYVLAETAEDAGKRISDGGSKAVAVVMGPARVAKRNHDEETGDRPAEQAKDHLPKTEVKDGWARSVFSYELMYGDYGATATLDFRYAAFGDRTVVFAFMYTNFRDQEPEISVVLKSAAWKGRERTEAK